MRNWLRIVTHVGALLPLVILAWGYSQGRFSIDPVRQITSRTGKTALNILVLSLACTPTGTIFGFKRILRLRRALGLYTFMYVGLHFLIFVGWDYGFEIVLLVPAVFQQPFVLAGFAALLILLSLALTSTQGWRRRLGKYWRRLHRLFYLAGILAVVHFLWLSKDPRVPLRYAVIVAVLLIVRIPHVRRSLSRVRRLWQDSGRLKAGT